MSRGSIFGLKSAVQFKMDVGADGIIGGPGAEDPVKSKDGKSKAYLSIVAESSVVVIYCLKMTNVQYIPEEVKVSFISG